LLREQTTEILDQANLDSILSRLGKTHMEGGVQIYPGNRIAGGLELSYQDPQPFNLLR
jgi:hypothetical protein